MLTSTKNAIQKKIVDFIKKYKNQNIFQDEFLLSGVISYNKENTHVSIRSYLFKDLDKVKVEKIKNNFTKSISNHLKENQEIKISTIKNQSGQFKFEIAFMELRIVY